MRVISKPILRDFWAKHAGCGQQLKSWHVEAERAKWKNANAIKHDYPAAVFLENNRVVFNINGNNYRLIIRINYKYQMIWIRFIGTHSQYDKIDAAKI